MPALLAELAPFPDADAVVREVILEAGIGVTGFSADNVRNEYPSDLGMRLPFVFAERVAGPSTQLEDFPILDVETFSAKVSDAKLLAGKIHAALLGYPRSVKVGEQTIVIDRVTVMSAPARRPWDPDGKIRRYAATYQLTLRR